MKTVYLLAIVLALPLAAIGQKSQNKNADTTSVFVQDNSALDVFTNVSPDNPSVYSWAAGAQSGPRVDLDLRNASVGEALKELFSKSKADYKVEDKDLPDTRINLTAK